LYKILFFSILVLLNSQLLAAVGDVPQSFTLEGQLYNQPTGTDPLLGPATIQVRILSPNKLCILYAESHSIDTTNSNGIFNLQVGSTIGATKRVAGVDAANSMATVFQNSSVIAATGSSCPGVSSYTPTTGGEARYVQILVTPTATGITDTLSPEIYLGSVPSSLVSQTLQGYLPSAFLRLGTITELTQANLENVFSDTNYPILESLLTSGASSTTSATNATINADNDNSGSGSILFQVNGATKAEVKNDGDFVVGTNSFHVDAATNSVGIGNSAPAQKLQVKGAVAYETDNSTNYVSIKSPDSLAATYSLVWPAALGTNGQVLTTSATGVLSWSTAATSASSVGGDLTGTIANAQIAAGAVGTSEIADTSVTYAKLNLTDGDISQAKVNGLVTALAGKEAGITSGTSAQYYRGDKTFQTLNTSVVPEVTNLYFLDSRVRAALMSGYSIGSALPIAATDTLIEALAKLEGSLASLQSNGQWTSGSGNVYRTTGNVGIGTTIPTGKLQINATIGGIDPIILRDQTTNANARIYFSTPIGIGPDLNIQSDRIYLRGINYSSGFQGLDGTGMISSGSGIVTLGKASTINLQSDNANTIVFQGGTNKDTVIRPYSSSYNIQLAPAGGNIGVGTTSPTAVLHLKAGTASSNTSPLKFTSGVVLTTPEPGAVEYDGTNLYFTDSTNTRRTLAATNVTTLSNVTSLTGSGALSISAGGTNQNLTLAASGTGSVTAASPFSISSSTASTTSSSGALVVSGGVGVGGRINATGDITTAGTYIAPLASASAPSYTFNGDTNTGVFSPGTDIWGISTAGSERMRVDASGRVGIGTTSPAAKLVVNDSVSTGDLQVGVSVNNTASNGYSVFRIGTATASPVGLGLHQFNASYGGSGAYTSSTTTLSAFESGGLNLHANNGVGNIRFFTAGSSAVNERMRIDSSGNVGIGTTSPNTALTLGSGQITVPNGTDAAPSYAFSSSLGTGMTYTAGNGIAFSAGGTNALNVYSNSFRIPISSYFASSSKGNPLFKFTDGNTTANTQSSTNSLNFTNAAAGGAPVLGVSGGTDTNISLNIAALGTGSVNFTNGNVGIGTTAPNTALDVRGALFSTAIPFNQLSYDTAAIDTLNSGSGIGFGAAVTGYNYTTLAGVRAGKENATAGDNSGYLALHTRSSGGNVTVKMRITSGGNVGIGTNSPVATSHIFRNNTSFALNIGDSWNRSALTVTPSSAGTESFTISRGAGVTQLQSVGTNAVTAFSMALNPFGGNVGIGNPAPAILLHVGSASVGTGLAVANFQNVDGTCTITPASSGSGIACSSDERLKENFKDVTGAFALDRILQLQAVTYNFKTSSTDNRRTGYKAQEVQKVAPEFVRENEDGLLQVYYDAFIPWITEAIKTLYGRISGVENHQDTQNRDIASLRSEKADKTEVDAKVQKLESENEKLKQENAAFKARLEKIEKALKTK
jgi:hypothetical protein